MGWMDSSGFSGLGGGGLGEPPPPSPLWGLSILKTPWGSRSRGGYPPTPNPNGRQPFYHTPDHTTRHASGGGRVGPLRMGEGTGGSVGQRGGGVPAGAHGPGTAPAASTPAAGAAIATRREENCSAGGGGG